MRTGQGSWSYGLGVAALLSALLSGCGDDDGNGLAGSGGLAGQGGAGGEPDADLAPPDSGDEDGQAGSAGAAGSGGNAGTMSVCEDRDDDGYRDLACGGDDCDDSNEDVHPGATELCNNDIDDDCSYATSDHPDLDGDGFDCVADCDDAVRTINPGRPEICGNAIDDDCDGSTLDVRDLDGDGYGCDTDCDETSSAIHPAADELCANAIDDDCNPATLDVGDNDDDGILCSHDCDDNDDTLPSDTFYCGTSYSYFEDFEQGPGGWTVSGDNASWQHGTPQGEVIEAAASGQSAWVTGIDPMGYNDDEASFLSSPSFDFGLLTSDPVLRFSRIVWIGSGDGVWVEMSTDGGQRWDRLPESPIDENLYTDADDLGFLDSPQWLTATTRLTGAAGHADVRVRLVMFSDDSNTYEGFGFDDVRITDQIVDASLDVVTLPPPRCADRSAEEVVVTVTNRSSAALTRFDVAYSVDNSAPVVQVVTDPLASGAARQISLDTAANLSALGAHQVRAWIALPGLVDEDRTNDERTARTHTFAQAGAPDYAEDFEQDGGDWVGLGTRSSWARGTPIGDPIEGAASGSYAWDTNPFGGHNPGESSHLVSPCFDFSSLSEDPVIAFAHAYSLYDGRHTLEVAVNGGGFEKVGTATSAGGVHWYNDVSTDVWSGGSGGRGQWRTARHPLPDTAGNAQVQVRFTLVAGSGQYAGAAIDDVRIVRDLVDAQITSVTFPEIECQGRSSTVQMKIANGGNKPLSSFQVSYQVDQQAPVVETVVGPIAPNDDLDFTFATALAIAALGDHTITVRALADGQVDAEHAIATHHVTVRPVVSGLDYREDFEADDGDWITLGAGSQWEHGRPQPSFADVITTAGSGEHAWVTRLFGNYGPSWNGDLVPPCFDFSGYSVDPRIRFDHVFHSEDSDPMWLELSTDGVTWTRVDATSAAVGWYNETNYDTGDPQWSGVFDWARQWHVASETLQDTAGEATVQLRYRFQANQYNTMYEGHGIDTVAISTDFVDMRVAAVTSVGEQCANAVTVSATLVNEGTAAQVGFDVAYQIDNGPTVVEHLNATVAARASFTFTASAPSTLSAGDHAIRVTVIATNDAAPSNDSAVGNKRINATVNAQGYVQSFESSNGGWSVSGDAPSWAWGTPSGTFIDAAASGTRAWVSNLSGPYNNNERSYLTTGCFDFSGFNTDPQVQLSHIFSLEDGYDFAWVEISTDGGASFTPLGDLGTGTRWYNDTGGWTDVSGAAGAWSTASHRLDGIAGEQSVMFRFALESDGSVTREGIGIDDFAIVP